MIRNFLILMLSLSLSLLKSQVTFVKGYVVDAKGDTLKGEVKLNPKKENDVYLKVFFKDASGVIKTYKPNKIKGYGYNELTFISMDSEGEPTFYNVLARGEINFYKLMFEALRMNKAVFEAEYYIAPPDNKKLTIVREGKFKKQLGDWMKDNPEFLASYEDEKVFDADKATSLIKQYNAWKASQ